MARKPDESWDSNHISRARRAYKAGGSLTDVVAAIGSKLSPATVASRLKCYGITFERDNTNGSTYGGTSKLYEKQRL